MAQIFQHAPLASDELVGMIDDQGKVFDLYDGQSDYLGWVDYENGEVYTADDLLLGYVTGEGEVVVAYEDEDISVGYADEKGAVYLYGDGQDDIYLGSVTQMKDGVEAAAALLFFFDDGGEAGDDE